MYKNHREAFQLKNGAKSPIESNLDNIINQAQLKMKEMILKKQETDQKTNLLIGQENVLNENIKYLENKIKNKKEIISSLNSQFKQCQEEIKQLEQENKEIIKEANNQEAKLKEDINGINSELEKIKYGTLSAEASKVFELKRGCEDVFKLKENNNKLREQLYLLSRRIYTLEVKKFFF
jgi:uncharacterized phage infection (PIP) family protein YhgE